MDYTLFLYRFWGWYLIIFFVILTFNPTRIKQIFNDLKDEKFLILSAYIAIIIGLINILLHNVWILDWPFLITIIGWIALFIGLALFTLPKQTVDWLNYINIKFVQTIYMLLFLLGVFLLNLGYSIVSV